MKKQFTLSVKVPCSEKWANFTPTANGGFCSSCRKNVIDFTTKSEREIIDFFNNKRTDTCGRFYRSQLRPYPVAAISAPLPKINWIHAGLLGLALAIASAPEAKAQVGHEQGQNIEVAHRQSENGRTVLQQSHHTISGKVVDEHGEPIPGVNVYRKDESVGVNTDVNGQFLFPQKMAPGEILVFSFIGYESLEYVVPRDTPPALQISMTMADLELMGEIVVGGAYVHKPDPISAMWYKFKALFQ